MRLVVGIIISLICSPLSAQWLNYPTAGIPRLQDGKPNLTAPAPRTADGKPDLSGIWGLACPVANAVNGTITGANVYCATEVSVPAEFFNFGNSIKDGLPYQPWAAEVVRKTRAAGRPNDPLSRCYPPGMVRLETFPLFRKMIQIPGLLVILNEHNASYRQIFTDGRPLPADPNPSWNGYSTATWEGDTLVVRTNGFRDGLWLDMGGTPMTDAATMTERMRRPTYGGLDVQITVDDPKAYTRPWTVEMPLQITLDTELIDEMCLENEKSSQRMRGK